VLGIERFGSSTPAKTAIEQHGFTEGNVVVRGRALMQG
jgi:transketolase